MQQRPPSLLGAAAVQAADALIVVAGSVLAAVDTIAGKSYETGSGIALTLIGLATAAALGWVALGLARARRWSRTPAAMTQVFIGIVGIYLVQGHQYAWGIPALLLACVGLALVLAPASLRALGRPQPGSGPGSQPPSQAKPVSTKTGPGNTGPGKSGSAKTGSAKTGAAKTGAAKTGAAKTGAAKTGAAKTERAAKPKTPTKPNPAGKRPARG